MGWTRESKIMCAKILVEKIGKKSVAPSHVGLLQKFNNVRISFLMIFSFTSKLEVNLECKYFYSTTTLLE